VKKNTSRLKRKEDLSIDTTFDPWINLKRAGLKQQNESCIKTIRPGC
jgi:hypothetical protein